MHLRKQLHVKIPSFKLERYFAEYEFETKYMLSASDCESMTIGELFTFAETDLSTLVDTHLGYTESQGHPELRQQISHLYSEVNEDQVLVFSGAEDAIFCIMNTLVKKGDHIIVQFPSYQSLSSVAESRGIEVAKWKLDERFEWQLDLEFLKKNIKSNTRLVVVNFPHNPTGTIMRGSEYEELIEICEKSQLLLLQDEVYRFSEFTSNVALPPAADLYKNALSLGVMSKTFGLPGLRIGWIVTRNNEIYQKLAQFKDYTTICNSAPSEIIAIEALKIKDKIIGRTLKILLYNVHMLDNFFSKYSHVFEWVRPTGASTAFPRLSLDQTVNDFCTALRTEKEVLLLPGSVFDYPSNFRIGFGRKNMEEGLNRLSEFLEEKGY